MLEGTMVATPRKGRAVWEQSITGFGVALRAAGRSERSIALRRSHLRQYSRGIGTTSPWAVTPAQLETWAGSQDWAIETRRSWRSTLRTFYGWGVRHGHVAVSPAEVLPEVRRTPPAPRPVSDRAYEAACVGADERERLALRLGAEIGMRRGEMVLVHLRDLVEDLVGWSLVIHGKGGRTRVLPITDALADEIRRACRAGGGWAFPGRIEGHLSAQRMGEILSARLPEGVSAHQLRHRFGTRAYAVDRDVFAVQDLLGHASSETTRRYVLMPRDALRRTVEAVAA